MQRYTALYTIQLYIAILTLYTIVYTTYATPLCSAATVNSEHSLVPGRVSPAECIYTPPKYVVRTAYTPPFCWYSTIQHGFPPARPIFKNVMCTDPEIKSCRPRVCAKGQVKAKYRLEPQAKGSFSADGGHFRCE